MSPQDVAAAARAAPAEAAKVRAVVATSALAMPATSLMESSKIWRIERHQQKMLLTLDGIALV